MLWEFSPQRVKHLCLSRGGEAQAAHLRHGWQCWGGAMLGTLRGTRVMMWADARMVGLFPDVRFKRPPANAAHAPKSLCQSHQRRHRTYIKDGGDWSSSQEAHFCSNTAALQSSPPTSSPPPLSLSRFLSVRPSVCPSSHTPQRRCKI